MDFAASPSGSRITSIRESRGRERGLELARDEPPGTRLGDDDGALRAEAMELVGDHAPDHALADREPADRRLRPQQDGARVASRLGGRLVDGIDDGPDLRHAGDTRRGAVEASPGRGQLAKRPDRVATADERPDVRAAAEALGEDLGSAVEPDRHAAPEQRPAIPRVDDRPAAGSEDPAELRCIVGGTQRGDRRPLAGPEPGLALLGEDLGNPAASLTLDHLVDVDERRAVPCREPPADGALAAPGKADQDEIHRAGLVVAAGAGLVAPGSRRGPR